MNLYEARAGFINCVCVCVRRDPGSVPRRSLSSPPLFWGCRAADTTPPLGAAGEFPYRPSGPAGRKHTAGGHC